jgi:thermostable 8-oxoguanine DNA glycosylase
MSENRLERFLEAYLKRVEEKFYKETGYTIYTISWLAEIAYKTVKLLRDRGFRHIEHLLNIREKKALQYLNTLTKLSMEESEKVADIVKNLIKHPEQYKKDFEEYIEYKPEK